MIPEKLSKLKERTALALRSKRGKNVLLYLLFLCVSFVFWVLLSLDSETQKDFEIPVTYSNIPENVTILSGMYDKISVTVKGNGYQLFKFRWNDLPELNIDFKGNVNKNNVMTVSSQKLDSYLRGYFGQGVEIMSVKPDSLWLSFTQQPGKSVPITINADVSTSLLYLQSGPISANVDSVKIFGPIEILRSTANVETEEIILTELSDTSKVEVRIKPINGVKIIPEKINITVPVEPLISKKRNVPIEVVGVNDGTKLLTYPSSVEVSYLVPMSKYSDDTPLKAVVEYNSIDSLNPKVEVKIPHIPEYYKNVGVTPNKVEYKIERKQRGIK